MHGWWWVVVVGEGGHWWTGALPAVCKGGRGGSLHLFQDSSREALFEICWAHSLMGGGAGPAGKGWALSSWSATARAVAVLKCRARPDLCDAELTGGLQIGGLKLCCAVLC